MSVFSKPQKMVILCLMGLVPCYGLADPSAWLLKINRAAAEVGFAGTFVHIHGGKVDTFEVARRIQRGAVEERLYSLNGSAREVIRAKERIWCYLPDQNTVAYDVQLMGESGFPRMFPGDYPQLARLYRFAEGGRSRIAGREAQQIMVIPNDAFRYGYTLWADTETGLLLRSDLVNQQNQVIEKLVFVDIDIGGKISDDQLAAVNTQSGTRLYGNDREPVGVPTDSSAWTLTQIPHGYQLSRHMKRIFPTDESETEHLVYTDGLSTVSVFITEAGAGQGEGSGISHMGNVHAYRTTLNNHRITVIGEVPADTVAYLGQGIEYRN